MPGRFTFSVAFLLILFVPTHLFAFADIVSVVRDPAVLVKLETRGFSFADVMGLKNSAEIKIKIS